MTVKNKVVTALLVTIIPISVAAIALTAWAVLNKGTYEKGKCPVCFDEKDLIKPFNCTHGVCKKCFKLIYDTHLNPTVVKYETVVDGVNVVTEYETRTALACPVCRNSVLK